MERFRPSLLTKTLALKPNQVMSLGLNCGISVKVLSKYNDKHVNLKMKFLENLKMTFLRKCQFVTIFSMV